MAREARTNQRSFFLAQANARFTVQIGRRPHRLSRCNGSRVLVPAVSPSLRCAKAAVLCCAEPNVSLKGLKGLASLGESKGRRLPAFFLLPSAVLLSVLVRISERIGSICRMNRADLICAALIRGLFAESHLGTAGVGFRLPASSAA